MATNEIATESIENYLKSIYHLSFERKGASVHEIASQVGVSAPGVTKMLQNLARHQMIDYIPYQPVKLTPLGEKVALEVIRHHRLLELYLMETLGYGWEQVHSEAERLEHHISEEFEEAIERLLGYPAFDPHGDPIPTRDGRMPRRVMETLDMHQDGAEVVIRRVTDEDPDLLRYLGARGLRPGTAVRILDREPFGGPLRLLVGEQEERVSPDAARHVFVESTLAEIHI
jgi:DtxR family Mn-dependent transcriptional regulator